MGSTVWSYTVILLDSYYLHIMFIITTHIIIIAHITFVCWLIFPILHIENFHVKKKKNSIRTTITVILKYEYMILPSIHSIMRMSINIKFVFFIVIGKSITHLRPMRVIISHGQFFVFSWEIRFLRLCFSKFALIKLYAVSRSNDLFVDRKIITVIIELRILYIHTYN